MMIKVMLTSEMDTLTQGRGEPACSLNDGKGNKSRSGDEIRAQSHCEQAEDLRQILVRCRHLD